MKTKFEYIVKWGNGYIQKCTSRSEAVYVASQLLKDEDFVSISKSTIR